MTASIWTSSTRDILDIFPFWLTKEDRAPEESSTRGKFSIVYLSHRFVPVPELVPKHSLKYQVTSLELSKAKRLSTDSPDKKNTVLSGTSPFDKANLGVSDSSSHTSIGLSKSLI